MQNAIVVIAVKLRGKGQGKRTEQKEKGLNTLIQNGNLLGRERNWRKRSSAAFESKTGTLFNVSFKFDFAPEDISEQESERNTS